MTDEIKKVETVIPKTNATETKAASKKSETNTELSAWELTKAYAEGFCNYYKEKYSGTTGIGDALSRTADIHNEGFAMMDEYNPLNFVKNPVKKLSGKIADKISDGNPDNLTLGERAWATVEGVGSVADNLTTVKGLTYTALTIGTAGTIVAASPTAAAAVKVTSTVAGEVIGGTLVLKGGYDVATADTEADAKNGGAELGAGTIALAAAAASAKDSLRTAQAAGIETKNPAAISTPEAMVENVKILPKVIAAETKEVVTSTQGFIAGLTEKNTGVIKAGSPELKDAIPYMSKANDVQAYRFNPNGTSEEILANNPGVYMKDGKFYLPNKWDADNPYLIDTSKEQMIMLYGGDDMAVCDGAVFNGSYVDTAQFKVNGSLHYQNPSQLKYGEIVSVTKQAPGAFKEVPVGTKVETLEGMRTVGKGEVVAVDHAGNPYVTPLKNITKRNIPVDTPASKEAFAQVQHTLDTGFKVKPELRAEFDAEMAQLAADKGTFGYADEIPTMKKIMAGLDALTVEGKMTTEGYASLTQNIDANLPGCFWNKAIQMYTKYGANANTPQTISAVQGYLSGVTTINGNSNLFRTQKPVTAENATIYAAGVSETVADTNKNNEKNKAVTEK